jgi:hypothetical protein
MSSVLFDLSVIVIDDAETIEEFDRIVLQRRLPSQPNGGPSSPGSGLSFPKPSRLPVFLAFPAQARPRYGVQPGG